jgi:hypothetical protein
MVKKYFGKFVPKQSWFDTNGDGDVDYKDFIAAAQNTLNALTPSKAVLDINGDGVIDIKDALDAARITGATIAGAGVTLGVGAVAGSVLVTGKATAIGTVIASAIGSAAGAGLGTLFGATAGTMVSAVQLANGVWILGVKTVVATSPTFVSTISSASAMISGTSAGAVKTIAGLPVIQTAALNSLVKSKSVLMIAGIPVAREVAIATGIVAIVISGSYAYYVLTRNRISAEDVALATGGNSNPA